MLGGKNVRRRTFEQLERTRLRLGPRRSWGDSKPKRRRLAIEPLEDRRLLSLSPIGGLLKVSDTDSAAWDADSKQPSVAYDSEHDRYLAVWRADTQFDGRDDVFGQFLDRQGNTIGSAIPIATLASTSEDAKRPDVAYNAREDEYLVVWKKTVTGATPDDVCGQRVGYDGTLIGSEIPISQLDSNREVTTPVVAYNDTQNEFLVVWDSNNGADMIKRIYGQRLAYLEGLLVESGGDFSISNLSGATISEDPDVAYNSSSDEYLVAWKSRYTFGGGHSTFEVYGQRLDGAAGAMGNNFQITNISPSPANSPHVVHNSTEGQYLLVYQSAGLGRIYGQLLSDTGGNAGAAFAISESVQEGATRPVVDYNPADNEYLVVWRNERGEINVHGKTVDNAGNPDVQTLQISSVGGRDAFETPKVTYNADDNQYLVVWEADGPPDQATDNVNEIFAQRVSGAIVFTDFGDAPDSSYPTSAARNGAGHLLGSGLSLGASVDADPDGQDNGTATGDDNDGNDDEEGVTFGTIQVGQFDATATVNVQNAPPSGARLDAWIDFNADGSWGGPLEQIADNLLVFDGDTFLTFDVPSWADAGPTYARFRLSSAGDLGPGGLVADGEVEDYQVDIVPPAPAAGNFSPPEVITSGAAGAYSVFAADLDGDSDLDVLSASRGNNTIAWYENDGDQNFVARPITTSANQATSVFAADVDGDGDTDVLSASLGDSKIAWYENVNNQSFIAHTISTAAAGASSVFAADVDSDGDTDVLSASYIDSKIAWYENDGNQSFTAHTISTDASGASSVFAADVDGDGDVDVLSGSFVDGKIAWYENDGGQNFTAHTISTDAGGAGSVFAADLDGDGDTDVLSASFSEDKIAWYENVDNQNFTAHVISTSAVGARSVFAADVNGDGDTDVLSASEKDNTVTWYENDGNRNFTAHSISAAGGPVSVFAADVDGDGDLDALSASHDTGTIAWHKNGPDTFVVTDFDPTPSGFVAQFSRPPDPADLNLYDVQAGFFGPADVALVGANTGPVVGSLVVNANVVRFITTGGPLPPDAYTVTLRSAADGFNDRAGNELLDGDFDNLPGGDYTATFSVSAVETVVVSLPDFSRGPGQPVDVPADDPIPGLPLRLINAIVIDSISLSIRYDPALLTVSDVQLGPNGGGGQIDRLVLSPGYIEVDVSNLSTLPPGGVELVTLTADVPVSAPYGDAHVLDLSVLAVSSGGTSVAATADDAIHVASYLGDSTGNASYSGLDAQRVARVGVELDTGFSAFPVFDPIVIADVTRNGTLTGLDAQRIALEAAGLDASEIPPLPQPLRLDELPPDARTTDPLTAASLASTVKAAVARSGFFAQNLVLPLDITFEITDLPGNLLGLTRGRTVQFDVDAAGYGWFLDPTPWDDVEYRPSSDTADQVALPGGSADGTVDLLTVVFHELGHVFGNDHADDGVMDDFLPLGIRRFWHDEAFSWAILRAAPGTCETKPSNCIHPPRKRQS